MPTLKASELTRCPHAVIKLANEEAEPLHPKNQRVQLLLDLGANEVDHGEVSQVINICDVNFDAGGAHIRRPETIVTSR